ncbi:MAG: 50S ribosomal protein L4 [Candidatus Njordarchaeota archaeon]
MKKVGVYSLDGQKVDEILLPNIFESPVRPDIIRRAFLAAMSKKFTPYGKSPIAGHTAVAWSVGKGYDIARIRRIDGFGKAAMAGNVVEGLRIRAPRPYKRLIRFINKKEKLRALESAIAAVSDHVLVQFRGHRIDGVREVPIVVVDDFEEIKKTKDVLNVLLSLGLSEELKRLKQGRRIRAGKGKRRGRRYKRKKGPLIIVSSSDKPIILAARNIEGVDVKPVDRLSILHLAPGGWPARLTIWTKSSISMIQELIEEKWKKLRRR